MARTKFMMHDCAYCHKQTKMERIGEMPSSASENDPQKIWYRCTRCKHSALITVVPHSKDKVFSIGQAIYHTDWDDVGTVLKKDKMSNGIHSILVSFEKNGERKLIENVVSETVEELSPQSVTPVS
jgi:hypothetical protein